MMEISYKNRNLQQYADCPAIRRNTQAKTPSKNTQADIRTSNVFIKTHLTEPQGIIKKLKNGTTA